MVWKVQHFLVWVPQNILSKRQKTRAKGLKFIFFISNNVFTNAAMFPNYSRLSEPELNTGFVKHGSGSGLNIRIWKTDITHKIHIYIVIRKYSIWNILTFFDNLSNSGQKIMLSFLRSESGFSRGSDPILCIFLFPFVYRSEHFSL